MEHAGERVVVAVPAAPEYLRLVRIAAADLGSRAGFDFEEIDDLRIGVSELCHLLLVGEPVGAMTLEFGVEAGQVQVIGTLGTTGAAPQIDELSSAIIAAVVDEHGLAADGTTLRFHMVKRSRAAATSATPASAGPAVSPPA